MDNFVLNRRQQRVADAQRYTTLQPNCPQERA